MLMDAAALQGAQVMGYYLGGEWPPLGMLDRGWLSVYIS